MGSYYLCDLCRNARFWCSWQLKGAKEMCVWSPLTTRSTEVPSLAKCTCGIHLKSRHPTFIRSMQESLKKFWIQMGSGNQKNKVKFQHLFHLSTKYKHILQRNLCMISTSKSKVNVKHRNKSHQRPGVHHFCAEAETFGGLSLVAWGWLCSLWLCPGQCGRPQGSGAAVVRCGWWGDIGYGTRGRLDEWFWWDGKRKMDGSRSSGGRVRFSVSSGNLEDEIRWTYGWWSKQSFIMMRVKRCKESECSNQWL